MVRHAVAIVLLCTSSAPEAIAAAGAPVGVPDAGQIETGAITVVHAALMIVDIVDDVAETVRERCALAAG